jgi:hypothetical protein
MQIVCASLLLLAGCQAVTTVESPAATERRVRSGLEVITPLLRAQLPDGARLTEARLTAIGDPNSAVCGWLMWKSADEKDFAGPFAATRRDDVWSAVVGVDEASGAKVEEHCRIPELRGGR